MTYGAFLLSVTCLVLCNVQYNEACGRPTFTPSGRYGGRDDWRIGGTATWRFSKRQPTEKQCQKVDEATITRDQWGAMKPRDQVTQNGEMKSVFIWQTGSSACDLIGLSGARCQRCLQDQSCLNDVVLALQDDDLKKGYDDIRFNFLVGQNGAIYEGRGWNVVGEHTKGEDDSSIGVAFIGDFSSREPSQASQNALQELVFCGKSSGKLTSDAKMLSSERMAGEAFYSMMNRCNGLCIVN